MTEPDPRVARWIESFVASEADPASIDDWVDRLQVPVLADSAGVSADAVLARAVRSTIRAQWLAFLTALIEPPREVPLVQAAVDLARDLARRGFDLALLFQLYRVAQQGVWEYLTSVVEQTPDDEVDKTQLLVFLWGRASAWLDASVEASAEVYREESERSGRGSAAQRLEAVRAVLGGHDPDSREVTTSLGGYPISGFNTAALLHTERYDQVVELPKAVTVLAQALRTRNPLTVSPGGRDLWCWFGTRSEPDLDVLKECSGWLAERDISVSVGTPGEGADGFRLSHEEAQQAEKLAFQLPKAPPLVRFADVELLCLVAASPEAARRFVRRTLGDLAEPGEGPERLRQTLHTLLSSDGVEEAARKLSVHKNTVRYRVSQAEELLGQPVSRRATEVELALRYHELFLTGEDSRRM